MKFFAKYFWMILPVALVVGTYREANSTVLRYWALSQDKDRVMETQKDLNRIIMKIAINYRATGAIPNDLKGFLELMNAVQMEERTRALDVDAWLTPYQLRDLGERYELVSCGPDRNCENEIDNLVEGAKKVRKGSQPPSGGKADKMDETFKNLEVIKKNADSNIEQLESIK